MHYHQHLGKQAVSFLRHLMKDCGSMLFPTEEYYYEAFIERLDNYPSLKSLLMSDFEESAEAIRKEFYDEKRL